MLKKDLRSLYKNKRDLIDDESLTNSSLSIANGLLKLPVWSHDYYHIFLPISENKEIDTTFILSILQGKDKNVVLPKVVNKTTLEHYLLTDSTRLKKNEWNIPEPVDGIEVPIRKIDVVFIPLLAFDKNGNRVGYGKGFYDRFLAECREDVIKIGLSLFPAEEELITDTFSNDIPLNFCVTPSTTYSF
ncbi:5-formyltetrahydrofolate cyclo-ligase [Zobellia amurskyensis]|uniref:5-formyltetrahydrofolate cyclo-ligase n=1 Tax=Zobellia amurskyensis TaxID=248905 RepID=A0A7X2ZWR1_9FLAO|nr:5-formyltetrahydrofolate cyclo-ligase [Zobellia amurskyensis]MUH37754.1 5-formyltetrahydrofolate cyclo-ligase [Zobellia amurskyensis]